MQVLPAPELAPFIKHYLFLDGAGNHEMTLRLFSDGNMGMVFSLKQPLLRIRHTSEPEALPNSFLYGQISAFEDSRICEEFSLVIVVFQPAGMYGLLGHPAESLQNQFIAVGDMLGCEGEEFASRLSSLQEPTEKTSQLNLFFLRLLSKRKVAEDAVITTLIQFVANHQGLLTTNQLVRYSGYSERQLERKFQLAIGMNPKPYLNTIRLHGFLKRLDKRAGRTNLTGLAYQSGYADQSHLIKEFKKFTGMTPKFYAEQVNKLTVNFVQIS